MALQQDHARGYPLKMLYRVICPLTIFPPITPFYFSTRSCLLSQMATGWTSAAFCPNHTMALLITSESTLREWVFVMLGGLAH